MKRDKAINRALSIFFTILSLAWIYPVFMIALNSFKKATAISTTTAFDLLTPETFNGLANYVHALNEQGFASAFMCSLIITVTSVVLILVCCSMCAWYVVRVNSKISNFFYYLFVFSMVVPFQMLMFTLSNLADRIGFNTPFNICFIYLGFGAGLAVFMFAGFVKNIPLENEEAAFLSGKTTVASVTVYDMSVTATRRHHRAWRNHRWRKARQTPQAQADRSARPRTEHRHQTQARRQGGPYAQSRQRNRGVRAGTPWRPRDRCRACPRHRQTRSPSSCRCRTRQPCPESSPP